ncbi:acyl-CoA dehydratase activase-related protein [Scatolibacter rhodanostii]|uniref:acyl-CoA dehydratase activase-related protein n=1 Tax=Scatolibacter rhodanostii TaxID=2014781 RepID=UPI000C0797F6|nr:acyl-CoA dehydratase activase-related protein [Scatolibacter rhodanostii]
MKIGLDVGSTTLKCVVYDKKGDIAFSAYERHFSQIAEKAGEMLTKIQNEFPDTAEASLCVSGSAGMGLAEDLGIPFVQEVYATRLATKKYIPDADVVIELGGEDAKILFLSGSMEVRMNGSCAGGTGAFIDQMATLLHITPTELNDIAGESEKTYSIASRCGVFAKSDIQALLNQGAQKNDISKSILTAVVNQTIAGLAQGREIKGKVVYLGGPLTFFSQLRDSFDEILGVEGICPENSLYFVAAGAALTEQEKNFDLKNITGQIQTYVSKTPYKSDAPLFNHWDEFEEFRKRHDSHAVSTEAALGENKKAYIGIDAGSTTIKATAINENEEIIFSRYMSNSGNPIPLIREFLIDLYNKFPGIQIMASASTGYGEEIIKNAFHLDAGLVETMAHFTAAKKFDPNVDFIIDIGGQDIKCFKIKNGTIDNIFLNEACSSGCGSFLQTFAGALGYKMSDFASCGLFADHPVDLGSRCTVFMNSSVKQAQKDGATIENISAGLSISVVKNALYKVIRVTDSDSLGQHIVVQGGTFLNNAVLRAFEKEIGKDVIRPSISGLMGAYGAALFAKANAPQKSSIIGPEELESFTHEVKTTTCKICSNHCQLTINRFSNGERYIAGNRCERPLAKKNQTKEYNLYDYKKKLLASYEPFEGPRGTIGIPMVLNMFELYPFWHTFFKALGFGVMPSPDSSRRLYFEGQHTIPSDTVCYPAKISHGHIERLLKRNVDAIFYPCMSYNIDEDMGDNNFNCPVVAYYPEVLNANIGALEKTNFIYDYVGLHRPKDFPVKMTAILAKYFDDIDKEEVKKAAHMAYGEYEIFMTKVRTKGKQYVQIAQDQNLPVIILAGRPYHLDGEINHGIDKLICECGAVVVTEDSISNLVSKFPVNVLNQWTYHSRLYAAAKYVADSGDNRINLVQLVSFGCGVDAITSDETRSLLEDSGRIYTQIKIDEITNLGAVKIRMRSLFAALKLGKEAIHG